MLEKALSLKQISNYLVVGLFVFAVTSFSLTVWVFPTYAAPNLSTFFSCETSDGCGYRYNDTLYLSPLPNNMTQQGNWSAASLVYKLNGNETITYDGSAIQRTEPFGILNILFTPSINGSTAIHIMTDFNGQPNAESIEIEVNASSISAGLLSVLDIAIDKGASTGGDIHALNVITVGSGAIKVVGLGIFSGIDVLHQHSGSPANMDRALIYDGSFSDVTAAFTSTGNDTSIFVSDDDSVYVGHASKFGEIQFNLDTIASGAGIKPTFEFSTGAGAWTVFNPIDTTDGMRDDGDIAYEKDDLTGWATDTVSGFVNNFWIRINRTQNGLSTVPIEDLVQIVVDTDFTWDKDGNIQIFGMNVTDALRVTGITHLSDDLRIASGKSIVSNAGGFPDIVTFTHPITINWNGTWTHNFNSATVNNIGASCNDMGNPNAFCAAIFSGNISLGDNNINSIVEIHGNGDPQNLIKFQSDSILIQTDSGGGVPTTRLQIFEGATAIINWNAGNHQPTSNNTLTVGVDAGNRFAGGYFVDLKGKTVTTGILIEDDINPLPSQYNIFENGDVVCAANELFYFKLCDQTGDELILGVVYMMERIDVIGINETGHNIYGVVEYIPMLAIEGPMYIKICSPVERGELLIAGNNGCAKGVNSLQGTTTILGVNIPNRILARDRAFAIAWEDSNGPMAAVHVRAA